MRLIFFNTPVKKKYVGKELDAVQGKLNRLEYPNLSSVESDIKRMVDNAKLLFHRTSILWENAEHIRELTSNFMVKYNPAYENPSYVATATPIHQMLLPMPSNN